MNVALELTDEELRVIIAAEFNRRTSSQDVKPSDVQFLTYAAREGMVTHARIQKVITP